MATPSVKTTYSLDVKTLRALDGMAKRWKVSRSEALRRIILTAASAPAPPEEDPIAILNRLQKSLALTEVEADEWVERVRDERRAFPRKTVRK
ncbi:MAG TPA: ribbon-helix-helix protein, CopG family [Candidatus Eisenbacteria bacterium]